MINCTEHVKYTQQISMLPWWKEEQVQAFQPMNLAASDNTVGK